ncbi:hypothetical protein [Lacrimispora sp.]
MKRHWDENSGVFFALSGTKSYEKPSIRKSYSYDYKMKEADGGMA